MTDRTLVLCKPDAVERKLVGEIIRRIEAKNLSIVALEMRTLDVDVAEVHYGEHDGKPFFGDLVEFITRSPIVALVVEGEGSQAIVRTLMGATNSAEAAPGTIRGDLSNAFTENLIHGSDSPESAAREIELFFPGLT
jgi:nucleoside-diphosphate kinase